MQLSILYTAARTTLQEVRFAPNLAPRRLIPSQRVPGLLAPARCAAPRAPARNIFGLVPPNQYENNILPKKFRLPQAMLHHWEIIPLILTVAFDIFIVLGSALYMAIKHKVDTQFSGHNWNCISRNMDLRHPTIHKMVVLYQRYEPWPEMQDALDKMNQAEHRNQARMDKCLA